MKSTILTIVFAIAAFLGTQAQTHSVTVTITGLENANGNLMLEMVDANDEVVKQAIQPLTAKTCTIELKDVKPGTYGIRFFHDENSNNKMDTGAFGIPKEGYGFSNDARGFMGPPDLEDMLFEVKGDVKMTLKTVN